MRAGGRGVLGVYYLLENIIHYYYCQSEGGGGRQKIPCGHRFIKILKKTKAIVQGFFSESEKIC